MLPQISTFFKKIFILELAFSHCFIKNHSFKIDPYHFILSFFEMMDEMEFSCTGWARKFNLISDIQCSANGLISKFNYSSVSFFKALLENALKSCNYCVAKRPSIARHFNKIWVTDSTCLSMPKSLSKVFPGSFTKGEDCATAKIQLTIDLLTDYIHALDITSFRNNDQSYSREILKYAKRGDLVIRDLGYAVIDVFKEFNKSGIYFISKLKSNIIVYDNQLVRIDLNDYLNKVFQSGVAHLDMNIRISKREIPVRMVVFKCTENEKSKRVKKAKKDRHAKANHSNKYYELLGFHVLITNIPVNLGCVERIRQLYSLRWRIEILFKCWKSHLNLQKLFKRMSFRNKVVPYCMLLLALTKLVVLHNEIFLEVKNKACDKINNPKISMLKFYAIMAREGARLNRISKRKLIKFLSKYSIYDNSYSKKSHLEKLYLLNSS